MWNAMEKIAFQWMREMGGRRLLRRTLGSVQPPTPKQTIDHLLLRQVRAIVSALRRRGAQNVLREVQLNKSCQRNCDVDRKVPCYSNTVSVYPYILIFLERYE